MKISNDISEMMFKSEKLNWFQRKLFPTRKVFVGFTTKDPGNSFDIVPVFEVYHIVDRISGNYTVKEIFSHNIDN